MRTTPILLCVVFSVTACTTVQVLEPPRIVEAIGTEPKIGSTNTTQVGSTMFSQYRLWRKTGIRIPNGYSGSVGGAPVQVTPADYLVRATADSQPAYCTERLTMRNLLGVPTKPTCFAGMTPESSFTKVMVPADAVWWIKQLPEPLRFEQVEEDIPRPESVRRELVYLGSAGKIIRLAYREYLGDLARPAFTQEVTYDVADLPMQVSFRNARFEVLTIGGSAITYRALSAL